MIKNKSIKNIVLIVIVLLIIGSIWYLDAKKPAPVVSHDVVVNYGTSTPLDAGQPATSTTSQAINATPSITSGSTTAVSQAQSNKIFADRSAIIAKKTAQYPKAKEFVDPTGFINSSQFNLSDIVGKKVVLLDFWTYSCINCQRTIPYLNAWYQKYKDEGLEIIGIHTPEFDFEKNYDNVAAAVKQLGIQYPVVLDSDQGTWNAYQNLYWPREYLIDIDGFIVHDKIGEGDYAGTEQAIQAALKERDQALGLPDTVSGGLVDPSDAVSYNATQVVSQETYFGANRNQYLGNGQQGTTGTQTLTIPSQLNSDTLYLDGTWDFSGEYAESTSATAKIEYEYDAKNVYMVASAKNPVPIKVYEDGKLVNSLTIQANMLYTLIQGSSYGTHTLEIEVDGSGLDAYTFTFG